MDDPMNAYIMVSDAVLAAPARGCAPIGRRQSFIIADAVLAILPDMVVPLVWNSDNGFSFSGDAWKAETGFGYYCVVDTLVGRSMKFRVYAPSNTKPIATRPTLEAAKAAANADNVTKAMAALGIEVEG